MSTYVVTRARGLKLQDRTVPKGETLRADEIGPQRVLFTLLSNEWIREVVEPAAASSSLQPSAEPPANPISRSARKPTTRGKPAGRRARA